MKNRNELNDGIFPVHQDDLFVELFNQIIKYFSKHSALGLEEKLFMSLCNFMQANEDHWLWDRVSNERFTEDNLYKHISVISKQIYKTAMYVRKGDRLIPYPKNKEYRIEWLREYKSPQGLLIRYSKKGYVAIKSISPRGLLFKESEFDLFCKTLKLNLDTLTWQQLERLIQDFGMNSKHKIWANYPSMKSFQESLEVEKELKPLTESAEVEYQVGKGYITETKKNTKDNSSTTMNVFDF
jgi:hypothetical protein